MKLELNVPTTLEEITLSQYQKFLKTQEGSNDDEFIAQKMVQIFCGIDFKDIVKMKLTDLNDLILHFKNLFEQKPKFKPTFKMGSQEFGFITKLEDITFGEYVDLEKNLQNWETYHKALAVMYRPVKFKFKDKYEIIDYTPLEEMQDLMKFAPLDIAISSSVFFWNLGAELLQSSLTYLETEAMKSPKMAENITKQLNLQNNGDGISQFTLLQKEILQSLTISQTTNLLNVSPIYHSKNKSEKLNTAN